MKKSISRKIKTLTISAMLVAISTVIAAICKLVPGLSLGPGLRITLENLPIVLAGVMFGPVIGACVGAAADIVSSIATGQDFLIFITIGALSVGLVAGIFSKYIVKKRGILRFIVADIAAQIVGSMIIKTFVLYFMFGSIVFFRIPIYLGIIVVEIIIFSVLYKNKAIRKVIDSYGAEEKNELL